MKTKVVTVHARDNAYYYEQGVCEGRKQLLEELHDLLELDKLIYKLMDRREEARHE